MIPKGWRSLEDMPGMVLYLNGDGIGAPVGDGGPIQIGLSVERFPKQTGTAVEGDE